MRKFIRFLVTVITLLIALLIVILIVRRCSSKEEPVDIPLPIVEKALGDSTSAFYANFKAYPSDLSQLAIGIFDSGTGGLTVLEKFLSLDNFDNITGDNSPDKIYDFAGEHFVYLADQANMPYGNYDAVGKSDYLKELVIKDALFVLGDSYYENAYELRPTGIKSQVKIIVIACNTATAYGLNDVSSLLEKSNTGVKVIGVINAGVKATLDKLNIQENAAPLAIGVLATPGTIASGAYQRTIEESLQQRGIKSSVFVVNQKGYGFAEAVDSEPDFVNPALTEPRDSYRGPRIGNGDDSLDVNMMRAYNFNHSGNNMLHNQLNSAENYARFNLVSLVEKHRKSGNKAPIKAIILGCTHYPFLIETLKTVIEELRVYRQDGKYLYKDLLADDLVFIDPAVYTAIECYTTLRQDNNLALRITDTELESYISVPSSSLKNECLTEDGKLTYDYKYGRECDTEEITTKQVPFSKSNIDKNNLQRIETLLPYSYSYISPRLY